MRPHATRATFDDTGQRHAQPVGSVRQLIFHLVQGFLQQKEVQHDAPPRAGWPATAAVGEVS